MSTAMAVYHGPFGRASLYRLDRALATHAHREGHLAFYIRGAVPSVTVSETTIALTPKSAAAMDPWQPHSFEPGAPGQETVVLLLYLRPLWFMQTSCSGQTPLRFGRSAIEVTPSMARAVALVASLMMDEQESPLFERSLFGLAHECFDQSWHSLSSQDGGWAARCGSRDFRVRNSIKLMQQRVGNDVVLDDIARDAGLSRPHFYKLFKSHVGITPNIYLNTLRMETAIERLTRSSDAVTAIGLDLGFASQASFTRFFTSNVGIPPSDYRRAAHLDELQNGLPPFADGPGKAETERYAIPLV